MSLLHVYGWSLPQQGTFWYTFLTGPAVGGLGALVAAIVIAGSAWIVSRHRRGEAGREEWFRRLQWAQELTTKEDTAVAGFNVMTHLADSKLASRDDLLLLGTLMSTDELEEQDQADEVIVDASTYVVENDETGPVEHQPEESSHG